MRLIVFGLVLLTGVKVWTQDRMHRAVLGDALVSAYRVLAIETCGKELPRRVKTSNAGAGVGPWDASAASEIVIGNSEVDVAMWDTENPRWMKRYRNPNLVLTSAGASKARCAYDVVAGSAMLSSN